MLIFAYDGRKAMFVGGIIPVIYKKFWAASNLSLEHAHLRDASPINHRICTFAIPQLQQLYKTVPFGSTQEE